MAREQEDGLASLDKVVVYGFCSPLAIRICSLVSLKSLPAVPADMLVLPLPPA